MAIALTVLWLVLTVGLTILSWRYFLPRLALASLPRRTALFALPIGLMAGPVALFFSGWRIAWPLYVLLNALAAASYLSLILLPWRSFSHRTQWIARGGSVLLALLAIQAVIPSMFIWAVWANKISRPVLVSGRLQPALAYDVYRDQGFNGGTYAPYTIRYRPLRVGLIEKEVATGTILCWSNHDEAISLSLDPGGRTFHYTCTLNSHSVSVAAPVRDR